MAVRTPVRLPDMYLDIAAKDHPVVAFNDRVGEIRTDRAAGPSAINDPVRVTVTAPHLGALEPRMAPCSVQDRLRPDRSF